MHSVAIFNRTIELKYRNPDRISLIHPYKFFISDSWATTRGSLSIFHWNQFCSLFTPHVVSMTCGHTLYLCTEYFQGKLSIICYMLCMLDVVGLMVERRQILYLNFRQGWVSWFWHSGYRVFLCIKYPVACVQHVWGMWPDWLCMIWFKW